MIIEITGFYQMSRNDRPYEDNILKIHNNMIHIYSDYICKFNTVCLNNYVNNSSSQDFFNAA